MRMPKAPPFRKTRSSPSDERITDYVRRKLLHETTPEDEVAETEAVLDQMRLLPISLDDLTDTYGGH